MILGIAIPVIAFSFSTTGPNQYPVSQKWSAHFWLYRLPPTRLGDFIVGISLAFAIYYLKPISLRFSLAIQITCVVAYLLVASITFEFQSTLGALSFDLLWLPIFAMTIFSLASTQNYKHVLSSKIFVFLGLCSFAFYLLHFQFNVYLSSANFSKIYKGTMTNATYYSILFASLLFSSWLLHKFIEQPAQKWLRKKYIQSQH